MATAGHQCTLRRSAASNTLTAEAMTLSGGNTVAQITSTSKRVLNPAVAITVLDNGVATTAFTVDYLFGKLTRTTGTFTGPVTISGAYYTMADEREPRSFSANCQVELFDTTLLGDQDRARALQGLRTADGELVVLDDGTYEIGTGITAQGDMEAGTRRVIELDVNSVIKFRAFVKLENLGQSVGYDGMLETTFAWQTDGADLSGAKSFSWGT